MWIWKEKYKVQYVVSTLGTTTPLLIATEWATVIIPVSATTTEQQQHDKYKAMSMLIMSVNNNLNHHIASINDSTQIRQILHDLFDNKNATQTMLLNQLLSTTMDKGSWDADYLQNINELMTELRFAEEVSKTRLIHIALNGMLPGFEGLIQGL